MNEQGTAAVEVIDTGDGEVFARVLSWPADRKPDRVVVTRKSGFLDRGVVVSWWESRSEFVPAAD